MSSVATFPSRGSTSPKATEKKRSVERPSLETALLCAEEALGRKALDLCILETGALSSVADYFVICAGRSDTQVQAIARAVEDGLRAKGTRPLAVEGQQGGQWILVDYADVVVHIFREPVRSFYDLEGMWLKAPRIELPPALAKLAAEYRSQPD